MEDSTSFLTYGLTSQPESHKVNQPKQLPPESQEDFHPNDGLFKSQVDYQSIDPTSESQVDQPPIAQLKRCDQCGYTTQYTSHLNTHYRKHTGNFFQCHLCPRHFSYKCQLKYHLKGHEGTLSCNVCGRIYTSITGLRAHKKINKH